MRHRGHLSDTFQYYIDGRSGVEWLEGSKTQHCQDCSLSTCGACIASKALSKVELISVGRLWVEVTHSDPLTAALWLCRQRDWDNRHHLCELAQIVTPNDQENMSKSGEVTLITQCSTSHCWGSSNEHDLRRNSTLEAKPKTLNSGLFQNCGCSR